MKKSQIGKRGENLATQYLLKEGMTILARNWRSGRQELDIIARDGDQVVFIEVKTRSSLRFGEPIEFVTATKQDHMVKAATQWLMSEGWEGEFRFDLIGILEYPDQASRIQHIRDAPLSFNNLSDLFLGSSVK